MVYCYHEFKLRYLKNQKLFSIRVKELFEPIVLKKKRRRLFAFFFKASSWKTDLWVTLGDFTVINAKLGRLRLKPENQLSWNEMCCSADNHNYMRHACAKEFLDSNLIKTVIDKISNFHEIAPKFHIFTYIVIFQVYLQPFRPTASSL